MTHNDDKLTDFILSEIKRVASEQGLFLESSRNEPAAEQKATLSLDEASADDFEEVKSPEGTDIQSVKKLTEEFRRMRELVDFRSPLLRKD